MALKLSRENKAYTLIEVLVSAALFSLAVIGPASLLVTAVRNQQKILNQNRNIDDISYVIEYMGRALRMAKKDDLGDVHCLSGEKLNYELTHSGQGIKFRNHHDECQEFYLEDNQVKENKEGKVLPLTPNDLEVKILKFNLIGETQNDYLQPRVTMTLGASQEGEVPIILRSQTSVSQRNLDIRY